MTKKELKTEMSDEQVWEAATERVQKNGLSGDKYYVAKGRAMRETMGGLIFDHEFAKCFFGTHAVCITCGERNQKDCDCLEWNGKLEEDGLVDVWLYHIAELAKAKDRIDYLRKFLDE